MEGGGGGQINSGSEDTTAPDLLGQETINSGVVGGAVAHFDICARDMVFEVEGKCHMLWRRHAAADKQMKVAVEEILVAEKVRRQRESGRRGKSEGGLEG